MLERVKCERQKKPCGFLSEPNEIRIFFFKKSLLLIPIMLNCIFDATSISVFSDFILLNNAFGPTKTMRFFFPKMFHKLFNLIWVLFVFALLICLRPPSTPPPLDPSPSSPPFDNAWRLYETKKRAFFSIAAKTFFLPRIDFHVSGLKSFLELICHFFPLLISL